MKNSSATLLVTFGLALMLLISQASCEKLYESVCSKLEPANVDKCLTLLKSDSKIASAKDYGQLSKVILQMAVKKGTEAQNYLKEMMNSNPSSSAMKDCATIHYNLLVNSFKSSLEELKEDALTANYDAKVAMDGPTTCNRALASENINNPSIASLNDDMSMLSMIAFFATDNL